MFVCRQRVLIGHWPDWPSSAIMLAALSGRGAAGPVRPVAATAYPVVYSNRTFLLFTSRDSESLFFCLQSVFVCLPVCLCVCQQSTNRKMVFDQSKNSGGSFSNPKSAGPRAGGGVLGESAATPSSPARGSGERCKFPSGARGQAPTAQSFWGILLLKKPV